MMKLIVAFHSFLTVPRNVLSSLQLTKKKKKLCSFLVQLLSEMGGDVSTSNSFHIVLSVLHTDFSVPYTITIVINISTNECT
jgi:hypothetical protein